MKIITLLILIFSSTVCMAEDFTGKWNWQNESGSSSFTINIIQKGNEYQGWYCSVAYSGQKIDCSIEADSDLSFKFINTESEKYTFPFSTYFSGAKGKAEIYLKSGKLHWKIIEQPQGEHYAPQSAVLIKAQKKSKQ